MEIKLPGNVVSIEVFRADRTLKALKGQCPHKRLGIDPLDGLY
jgi:nitrite reductase/ring-hydroxylating ferredoxin subunit